MTRRVRCSQCGMLYDISTGRCPKCDTPPYQENRRATLTVDIAHHGQRMHDAIEQFEEALQQARDQGYGYLRLIVGSGKINKELALDLETARWRGLIKSYQYDDPNLGAYLVKLAYDRKT